MIDYSQIPSPCYVMEESLLRRNLALIKSVRERADVDIIMAFKAFALWKSFPIIREYVDSCTASSLFEAHLAVKEFKARPHIYSPAYTEQDFPYLLAHGSHITFNSLSQYTRFAHYAEAEAKANHSKPSFGLRINAQFSAVDTDLYNPSKSGTRFGITADKLPAILPNGIEGFHCHTLCESSSHDLDNMLTAIENKFGQWLPQLKWLNLGGGHLMTRKDYDVEHLISILIAFKQRYPNLNIILEPGAAFVWQTGVLHATVVDIVENDSIQTAILNVSFTCHMPDTLEMPYQPEVRGAAIIPHTAISHHAEEISHHSTTDTPKTPTADAPDASHIYRLGGNSCLSGDYIGDYNFDHELQIGERLILEDMIHYTTVKTNMFNGISHPSVALLTTENKLHIYRTYTYEDYRDRMC